MAESVQERLHGDRGMAVWVLCRLHGDRDMVVLVLCRLHSYLQEMNWVYK